MKGKLLAFGVALMAVATIGVVQLQTNAAEPGQVGDAPRCTVEAKGQRDSAFKVNGSKATVDFTVKGQENCKVQVSGNSFYAPSMDGTPYEQQTLFDRKTKELSKGEHSITVNLPTKSTKQKGCFYQVDLTYGTNNVRPVLAYGHGKIEGCGEDKPKPIANCVSLVATMQERTKYSLVATADAKNGAKIKSYTFTATKDGKTVFNNTYDSDKTTQSVVYQNLTPGEYQAKVVVTTSEGKKEGPECATTLTVTPEPTTPTPGIDITKVVTVDPNSPKYARVNENVEFSYKISVINTGNTDLEGVTVTDTPDKAITLLRIEPPLATIENNSFVIRNMKLLKGETRTFVVYAKVPAAVAGKLTNTVCVDAPTVPGNPDKCDKADVEVPPKPVPGKVRVCDVSTKTIIEVPEDQKDQYEPENSENCKEQTTTTPAELPETGPVETTLSVIGAMSLVGSAVYYVASRRQA